MKCPICVQEVQPLDHQERWGPEFAHSRCIIAFNAGSAVQDAKLQTRIKRLEEAGDKIADLLDGGVFMKLAVQWHEAKEDKL